MRFTIKQWNAYTLGCSSPKSWECYLAGKELPLDREEIDVSFLPALQRRRLTSLAKMVFHVAWPLGRSDGPQPLVFSSRHGDNIKNLALLVDVANKEPLSPASFSLSVHNAITGLWSIYRQQTAEMIAIAARRDSLETAVIEACLLLNQGHSSVLVVVAEDSQPEFYQPWIDDVPYPYALALEIAPGNDWQLTQEGALTILPFENQPRLPAGLSIISLLLGKVTEQIKRGATNQAWRWKHHVKG